MSTRVLLVGFGFSAGCVFSGCHLYHPEPDKNGNLPSDVVREFLDSAKRGDYEAAQQLWYGDTKRASGPIKFSDFCSQYKSIDFRTLSISRAYRGKAGFSMVDIDWPANGKMDHDVFGLELIDGEWKLHRGIRW